MPPSRLPPHPLRLILLDTASLRTISPRRPGLEREQAAEAAAVEAYGGQSRLEGRKADEKYLVVHVGLKSEGLVPLEAVGPRHPRAVGFQPGDIIEVVIEREEPEGEKAQRLRVWDTIEKAANDKTPVTGTVVASRAGSLSISA